MLSLGILCFDFLFFLVAFLISANFVFELDWMCDLFPCWLGLLVYWLVRWILSVSCVCVLLVCVLLIASVNTCILLST